MNSVALAFLNDIDELVYTATVSSVMKELLAVTEPLSVESARSLHLCRNKVPMSLVYLVAVMLTISAFLFWAWYGTHGKMHHGQALECLCQVAGEECSATSFLGGYRTLEEAIASGFLA